MANIINTGSFPRRLLEGVMEFYGFDYERFEKLFPKFLNIVKSNKAYEDIVSMAGMGLPSLKTEGQSITYSDIRQAYPSRAIHAMYSTGFVISHEMMEDDQYSPKLVEEGARAMAEAHVQGKEINAHAILNGGFTTTLCQDTTALFGTAHTCFKSPLTFSNTLTVQSDLNEGSLTQMIINTYLMYDEAGLRTVIHPRDLIVHPNDWANVQRLLKSAGRTNTANNDINVFADGLIGEAVVSPFLTSGSAWFLTTSANVGDHGLTMFERENTIFRETPDDDTLNMKYNSSVRYSVLASDPRACMGSSGS